LGFFFLERLDLKPETEGQMFFINIFNLKNMESKYQNNIRIKDLVENMGMRSGIIYVTIPSMGWGDDYLKWQESMCRMFCEDMNIKIERTFSDAGSGSDKDGLLDAVKYCEENKIEFLATFSLRDLINIPVVEQFVGVSGAKEFWEEVEKVIKEDNEYCCFIRRLSLNGTKIIPIAEVMNANMRAAGEIT
jgi:hypothetical protein